MSDSKPNGRQHDLAIPAEFHEARREAHVQLRQVLGEIACLNRYGAVQGYFGNPPEFGHPMHSIEPTEQLEIEWRDGSE
jgi:hypothetical protein